MKVLFCVAIIINFLCVAGCPATYKVKIFNDSEKKLYILSPNSDKYLALLNPRETGIFYYDQRCLMIKVDNEIFEYKTHMPVKNHFYHVKIFSVFLDLKFLDKDNFFLFSSSAREKVFLKRGINVCNGGKNNPKEAQKNNKGHP